MKTILAGLLGLVVGVAFSRQILEILHLLFKITKNALESLL